MEAPAQKTHGEAGDPRIPKARLDHEIAKKKSATERVQEVIRERNLERVRVHHLEGQIEERDHELAQLRAERQQHGNAIREDLIPAMVEKGRKLFVDFDAVISAVNLDAQAFAALLTSTNGPELMYAAGVGFRALAMLREVRAQAAADKQRVEYYRNLHQQHFAGAEA